MKPEKYSFVHGSWKIRINDIFFLLCNDLEECKVAIFFSASS